MKQNGVAGDFSGDLDAYRKPTLYKVFIAYRNECIAGNQHNLGKF